MATQNISNRLVVDMMTQVSQGSDYAIVSPAGVFTPHSHDLGCNCGTTWILPMFATVELLSDELSIPSQDGVWPGNTSDFPKCPAS